VVDANDVCATTSDRGMMRTGTKNTGPGTITVDGFTLSYEVSLAALNPALTVGDTVYIWADTQARGIVDRAPNTDASDGCADPEEDTEVLTLSLAPSVKRVFVTSTTYPGDLDGLDGADSKCQGRAVAAGLPGMLKAWLSDSTQAARDRLTHATVPYVRVDDVQVAADWDRLVDGTIEAAISIDENGDPQGGTVWTATNGAGGTLGAAPGLDWTSAARSFAANEGEIGPPDAGWTQAQGSPREAGRRLYCFEQ
jgi:hypothetical protein